METHVNSTFTMNIVIFLVALPKTWKPHLKYKNAWALIRIATLYLLAFLCVFAPKSFPQNGSHHVVLSRWSCSYKGSKG